MISLIVTAALCLLVFLLSVKRPQWGILIIATLVPFHGVLYIAPVASSWWKEAAVLAVAGACIFATRPRDRMTLAPWLPVALVLVVFGVISGVAVLGAGAAFPVKIAFFYLIPTVIVYFFPFTRRDKDLLVTSLLWTGLSSALFGLWQQLVGGWVLADLGYDWNEHIRSAGPLLRSFGTFNQPFPFGFYMMVVLVIGGATALAEPGRWRSRFFWLISPILLVSMATSVVRAAIIGLLAAVIVLGVVMHRWILRICAAIAGLGALILPLVLLMESGGVLATMLSPTSLLDRGGHWSAMLPQMLIHPFGMGLGTTGAAAERVHSLADSLSGVYQPDNQYLKIGLELGLLGLALYALVVGIALVVLRRLILIQRDPLERAFTVGALAVTVAALVAGAFSTYLEIFPLDFFFWLLLAVAASVPSAAGVSLGGWSPRRRNASSPLASPAPSSSASPERT
ncbi:O-antigen ligase family protein [Corynebacterium sp. A21]|uniref:O-antigen ligase family protein n=1 Tax=Corynebacterium sp. A21 TaxID=3457318 RepID=UPI003FD27767